MSLFLSEQSPRECNLTRNVHKAARSKACENVAREGVTKTSVRNPLLPGFQSRPARLVQTEASLKAAIKARTIWTTLYFAHTINETFKCPTQLPALMQSHSGGDDSVV